MDWRGRRLRRLALAENLAILSLARDDLSTQGVRAGFIILSTGKLGLRSAKEMKRRGMVLATVMVISLRPVLRVNFLRLRMVVKLGWIVFLIHAKVSGTESLQWEKWW